MTKNCIICNREYITYKKQNSKYCSNECKHVNHSKMIICKFCGITFVVVASDNKQFCSKKCQYAIGMTDATKHKISVAEIGKKVSPEVVAKIAAKIKKFPLNRDELYELYWDKNKGINEIGILLSVDPVTVLYWLKKYDIPRRERGNPFHRKLSPEAKNKISAANKGKKPCLGKKWSVESKKKVGMKNSQKRRTDAEKKHLSEIQKGKPKSLEFVLHLKKYYAIPENKKEAVERFNSFFIEHPEKRSAIAKANWQNPEFVQKQMKSRHVTPNKTELKFLDIINSISPQPFKYVGDGQLIVAGKCPDFVCETNDKLLVELYGDYWHRGENPEERINLFAEKGYKTLVLWEKELKELSYIKSKILNFVGV